MIGLDVDAYDQKIGGMVLWQLEQNHGPLPPTWRSTSRDDGTSGIRLYRIPPGLRWPTEAGPGIEFIRHEHRYMVVWPSIHPNGGTYRWINPDGAVAMHDIPTPDDLPDLPAAWVDHFTHHQEASNRPTAGLDHNTSTQWVTDHGAGDPCDAMHNALTRALDDLDTAHAGSRHDTMLRATNRLAWMAATGHTGLAAALDTYQGAWLATLGDSRGRDEAHAEWARAITGAADRAAGGVTNPSTTDPCTDPVSYTHLTLPTKA